jgi:hypothetical protein
MKNTILFLMVALFTHSMSATAQCPAADPSTTCTSTVSAGSATNYTVLAGEVLCITGGAQTGNIVVQAGGILQMSGGTANNNVSVQSGGQFVLSGGTLSNGATLPTGSTMFVKNNPTINNTLSVSGGTINVLSGATFSKDINASAPSIINNCGTITNTGSGSLNANFNSNVTLNNYSTSILSLKYGGNVINNFATNADIRFKTVDVAGGVLNNYGSGLNFQITNSWNQGITFNNKAGASMTVVSVPGGSMPASTVFNNSGTSLTYSPVLSTTGATFINDAGSTLNFTSSGSANSPKITNNGTMNVSGTFYLAGNTTNNNGTMTFSGELRLDGGTLNMGTNSTTTTNTLYKNNGSINMNDHSLLNIVQNVTTWNGSAINLVSGCATILGSTTPSTTNINSTFLNNVNLNFCGSAPAQAPAYIAITAVTNSVSSPGRYRIAMGSGPATNGFVQIAGVTGVSNLNGLWKVINNGDGTWDLIGSSFTAGAVFGSSQVVVDQTKFKLGTGTYLGYSSCANPCAPLPIKLVLFSAVKENNGVKIAWQTLEETNNDYYAVERSIDGINYETILTVSGNRNSTSIINYIQYDNEPLAGISYYRLKQVDLDGTYTYSSIAVINFENTSDWNIYPNPSDDGSFTITSYFSEGDVISVTVTDVTGNRVRYYESDLYAQKMQISDLSSGLYIVTLQTISGIESKKLVVK